MNDGRARAGQWERCAIGIWQGVARACSALEERPVIQVGDLDVHIRRDGNVSLSGLPRAWPAMQADWDAIASMPDSPLSLLPPVRRVPIM